MANIIVTKTVNEITWKVDQSAYSKALGQIRSLKKEWEKSTGSFGGSRVKGPASAYLKSAAQAKLVNKRLQQTERSEQAKTTAHNIAMAKKEARARAQIDKIENARRKQAVSSLTNNRTPESRADYEGLKAKLRNMEKTGGGYGTNPEISAARQAAYERQLANNKQSGNASGIVGDPNKKYDPDLYAAQIRQMQRGMRVEKEVTKEQIRAREQARKKMEAEDLRYSKYLAGKESTVSNASVRLRSKYGDNYASKMGGFDELKERFLNSNTMKSSNFRAELAAMEQQMKSANQGAMTFSQGLTSLRRSLISVTAAYSAFNAGAQVLSTGQFFQGLEASMLMISDDSVEAGQKMDFVRKQSYRLGLELKTAAQGYTQMSIAAQGVISKADNDKLFKSFSEYSTALQVDPVKYQRGITAIQQMLGKGQVMAEELKGQLSEAIPGSMQAFVAAAQKYMKNDKIGVKELQELMKDGKILSKDILPLVADEFAKMANKGGALNKALAGNRVAMERLRQTWMNFQNQVFESGFGDAMTETFNNLAEMLGSNGPTAKAIGELSQGFVEGFMEMVYTVNNAFVLIDAILQRYIPSLRRDGDEISSIFKWTGWALGAIFFAASLTRVFSILSKIIGISKGLKTLSDIFGDGGGIDGDGGGKRRRGLRLGKLGKIARVGGLYGLIAGESMLAGDYLFDQAQDYNESKGSGLTAGGNLYKDSFLGKGWDFFANAWSGKEQAKLSYLSQQSSLGGAMLGGPAMPSVIPTEPVSGEITIKLDAGELRNMIDQQIETSNMGNINLLLGVPQ